jgi:hypothetical protein
LEGYPFEKFLKCAPTIVLPAGGSSTASRSAPTPAPYSSAKERVKNYLKNMLQQILEFAEEHPNALLQLVFKDLDACQAVEAFK